MTTIKYNKAFFLKSVAHIAQLPPDEGIEVAFSGRSNVGKSSVLNVLTNQKKLARISKTPGRTQHINLFSLDEQRRLVDLPGYGYAKVSLEIKQRWQRTLSQYLKSRNCLRGLILIMDIRHPLKEYDHRMLEWAQGCHLSIHIVLNKSDKLSRGAALVTLHKVQNAVKFYDNQVSVQLFSVLKNVGLDELKETLEPWFRL